MVIGPHVIFLILAFVLFLIAAAGYPPSPRINLGWLGLAFLALALWFR